MTSNVPAELETILREELERAFPRQGAAVRELAARISTNATVAAALGRVDLVEEARAAALALAEAARLRVSTAQWGAFSAIVGGILRAAAVATVADAGNARKDGVA